MVGLRNAAFAEESAEVELLLAEAKKYADIGKKMLAVQTHAEERARSMRNDIDSIYRNTEPLKMTIDNVDKILAVVERFQKPLEGKADEERIVHEGPQATGVQQYMASLRRVEQNLLQLQSVNLRANLDAVAQLSELLAHGGEQLKLLFESMLGTDANTIEPLHYITKELPFPTLSPARTTNLSQLVSYTSDKRTRSSTYGQHKRTIPQIYAEIRGTYLQTSLQNLASASISTSRKKSPDDLYRQGTSGLGTYASGMEGSFLAEWQNINAIFPRDECSTVFELTIRKSFSEFSRTIRELNTQIKSSITTDCFLAYEIFNIVNHLAFRMDNKTRQLKQQLVDAVKPIRDTAKASFSDLVEDIKRRIGTMISAPSDGAAIPFTTEVMARLQTMVAYQQPLSSILISLSDGSWLPLSDGLSTAPPTKTSFDIGADGSQRLAHYILDSIEVFLSSLEAKGRVLLRTNNILGIFLLNNISVMSRMIRSSDLEPLLVSTGAINKIESLRKKNINAYLDAWRAPCFYLMDVQNAKHSGRPASGAESAAVLKSLNGKEKETIKDKFKNFNISFEGLAARHREMARSMEHDVKVHLGKDIQAMVEPLYARFWDRYHDVDKGKGKYVRFDKSSLASQLANLS